MFSPLKIRAILCILLFLPIFVPGCSLWDSATSYFNTFYNAQKVYTEAENEIWTQRDLQRLGRNYYLGPITNANKTKFTSVIEKCSKLLQYHPESSFVDDALLMIGMSYYYTDDNQAADRKFRELLDRYPDSKFALRSRMMLAYTLYRTNNKDTAAIVANGVLEEALQDGDGAVAGHSALLLGRIEQDKLNFDRARQYYVTSGENGENPELRVTAFLAAADVAEKASNFNGAEKAYEEAVRSSRNYVGEYRGELGSARMLIRLGEYQKSLDKLHMLRSNQNNKEFWGEIEYEIGNCYRIEGRIGDAIAQYSYVDTAYARTENAANADYQLAQLYEYTLTNLDSARTYYARGKLHAATGAYAPILNKRADILTRYIQFRNDLTRIDSLRGAWVPLRDSLVARQDSLKASALAVKPALPDSAPKPAPPKIVLPNIDSLDQRLANVKVELATLFYTSLDRPDSAMIWYKRFVAEYPAHAGVPRSLYTMAQIIAQDTTRSAGSPDSLYRLIIERFPTSEFAVEARKTLGMPPEKVKLDESEQDYSQAQRLVLAGNYQDAVIGFRRVVDQYPKSPMASRAQYAIGWIYENQLVRPDSAIVNYQLLVSNYPTSPFVSLVQAKLSEVQQERSGAKKDSVSTKKEVDLVPPSIRKEGEEGVGRGRRARQPQNPEKPPEKD